jgi:DNA-binding CsgD family transcriptional regulator
MTIAAEDSLFGRDGERAQVSDVLAFARKGDGGSLRLVGAAGVGKSTLLAAAAADALDAGMTVLRTTGCPAERLLPFAALHNLIAPLLRASTGLPPAQLAAVNAAFGLGGEPRLPNRFLLGLAMLELLADAATERPVALIVDDWHWLDARSADTLDFVARRIDGEPIVLLTSERGDVATVTPDDRRTLSLEPLTPNESELLLDHRHPGLAPDVRHRVLTIACGNPLALIELPKAERDGDTATDGGLPRLTQRLEQAFGGRVATLPRETRLALLVAALHDERTVDRIAAAAPLVGAGPWTATTFGPAVAAGLVRLDSGAVVFSHPLVRAAVEAGADDDDRRRVHDALARLADDPDRAVWHRSAGVTTPDEALAADIDAAAEHAAARGHLALGHTLFARAARLSVAPASRAHRSVRAAETAFQLGRPELMRPLIENLPSSDLSSVDRARLVGLEMASDDAGRGGVQAVRRFLAWATVAAEAGEPRVAAGLVLVAARNTSRTATEDEMGDAILAVAEKITGDADAELLLRVAEVLVRPFTRREPLIAAIDGIVTGPLDGETTVLLAMATYVTGDLFLSLNLARRAAGLLRQEGRHALLVWALVIETYCALFLGRWDEATMAGDETARLAVETSQPVWAGRALLAEGMLVALRGDRPSATRITAEIEHAGLLTGNASLLNDVQMVRGVAALGDEQPEAAWHELLRMHDREDPAFHSPQFAWSIDYLAEAAAACGRQEECREIVEETARLVAGSQAPAILRSISLARLLVARDEEFPDALAAATTNLPTTPWHRARRDLAHGKWLRRHRDIAAARRVLGAASGTFEALGATAWAQAAARELAATGATPRHPAEPDAWARLSAQELQVATLAAQGLSNREIGARLFLSHRTVAAHLYRGFPKLGITSRGQLHLVLPVHAEGLES